LFKLTDYLGEKMFQKNKWVFALIVGITSFLMLNMSPVMAHSSDQDGHSCKHCKSKLSKMDTDGDDKISRREFMKYHGELFNKHDLNKDRFLDMDEIHWMMEDMHKHMRKHHGHKESHGEGHHEKHDHDDDGDQDEHSPHGSHDDHNNEKHDHDNDGDIEEHSPHGSHGDHEDENHEDGQDDDSDEQDEEDDSENADSNAY